MTSKHIVDEYIKKMKINVLYLTDDNYAPFAGISITSLLENNRNIDLIRIFLIDDNIKKENKDKFTKLQHIYSNCKVEFLDMAEGIEKLKKIGAPKYRNSYTTYLKLFAFRLLPDDVDRVFFIDSDTIVVGSIAEMIDFNMDGHVIAAVRDGLCASYKVALGYSKEDSWFNMGVMLVDIKKWKHNNCEDMVIRQLEKRAAYFAVDQDLLNITQHGDISTLSPKYNATPHHYIYREKDFLRAFPQKGFYSEEELEESQKKAVIRHFERFIGESPWHKNSIHPYTKLFDKYMSISLWSDYVKRKPSKNFVLKIEKILYLILPKRIFIYIYAICFKILLYKTNNKFKRNTEVKNIK